MIAVANTEGSVRAVCSALVDDTLAEVEEINACVTEGKGKRALEARETKCRDLLGRLERFASVLGPKLDAIKASVDSAQASVAVAMLAANAEDDATDGAGGN